MTAPTGFLTTPPLNPTMAQVMIPIAFSSAVTAHINRPSDITLTLSSFRQRIRLAVPPPNTNFGVVRPSIGKFVTISRPESLVAAPATASTFELGRGLGGCTLRERALKAYHAYWAEVYRMKLLEQGWKVGFREPEQIVAGKGPCSETEVVRDLPSDLIGDAKEEAKGNVGKGAITEVSEEEVEREAKREAESMEELPKFTTDREYHAFLASRYRSRLNELLLANRKKNVALRQAREPKEGIPCWPQSSLRSAAASASSRNQDDSASAIVMQARARRGDEQLELAVSDRLLTLNTAERREAAAWISERHAASAAEGEASILSSNTLGFPDELQPLAVRHSTVRTLPSGPRGGCCPGTLGTKKEIEPESCFSKDPLVDGSQTIADCLSCRSFLCKGTSPYWTPISSPRPVSTKGQTEETYSEVDGFVLVDAVLPQKKRATMV